MSSSDSYPSQASMSYLPSSNAVNRKLQKEHQSSAGHSSHTDMDTTANAATREAAEAEKTVIPPSDSSKSDETTKDPPPTPALAPADSSPSKKSTPTIPPISSFSSANSKSPGPKSPITPSSSSSANKPSFNIPLPPSPKDTGFSFGPSRFKSDTVLLTPARDDMPFAMR